MTLQFDKKTYLNLDSQPLAGTTLTNWLRVLLENRFHISWPFIPRALYVSLMVTAITPLRIKENRFCTKHCKDINITAPLFIIGHWRSGTTFLHYLMGKDPNFAYVSTMETLAPNIFLTNDAFLHRFLRNRLPTKRPMDNLELHADLPYEDEYALANMDPYSFYHGWYFPQHIEYYFRKYVLYEQVPQNVLDVWEHDYTQFLKKISLKKPGKRILLKSLVNTAKIKQILKIFPDAQFIHIYRNPYDVYKSTWKLYDSILPLFSFQHVDRKKLDNAIITIYQELFHRYLADKSYIPKENLYEIQYENFIQDPLTTLKNLYTSLKLEGFETAKPYFEDYIRYHKNYQKDSYTLNQTDKEKIYQTWGFTFDAFGYHK